MKRLKNIDWADLAKRAGKTFFQTLISSLTIDGIFGISDKAGLQRWLLTTGLSALAAAVSAVWNLIIGIISDKAGEMLDKIGQDDYTLEDDAPDPDDPGKEPEPGDLI